MKITIKNLYDFVCHIKNKKASVNEQVPFEKDNIKIKDENGELISISSVIKKEDNITEIELEDSKIKTANKHLICVDGVNCVNVSDIKEGDYVWKNNKKSKIKNINRTSKYEDVYDIGVESKTHLFQTADGVVHHNSRTVENIMSLLKMQIITIEAPHVSEEDIISIPYLVKRGVNVEQESSSFKETSIGFEVINAESALITRLKRKKRITDSEYNAFLNKNKILTSLANDNKEIIEELGEKYSTVLFLDEFYRSSSKRIQNLFRTILNGKLGTTPIPANVYIIYASNMDNTDGSLDDIPLNHQFDKVNFDTPDKSDFMRYMADKFTNTNILTGEEETDEDSKIKNPISTEVFNAFEEALADSDLGGKDDKTGIRISPRRWEEIIKYVSANIPPDNIVQARALISFMKDNFTNYAEEETSELLAKYDTIVRKLIQDNSSIEASMLTPLAKREWRHSLSAQINSKLKMGDDRKYVPIISGAPGIGKTTIIDKIAIEYNLNKIIIDASTLNSDDAMGLTTPSGEGRNLTTEFSEPPLYTLIMKDFDPDKKPDGDNKYTHILFIDEISRTTKKVFNSIRSLMLDKKVGNLKLPDSIMIVAAMNPKDKNTEKLSDHFQDVVDVIDSEADFTDTMDYILQKPTMRKINEEIGFDITNVAHQILLQTVELFESDTDTEDEEITDVNTKKFFWTDGFNTFYISAREMDAILTGCVEDTYNFLKIKRKIKDTYTDEDVDSIIKISKKMMLGSYKRALDFIVKDKAEIADEDFQRIMIGVEGKIDANMYLIEEGLNSVKSEIDQSIKSIFEGANFDLDMLLNYDGIETILEKSISANDANTVILDFAEVIDILTNFEDSIKSINDLISLWELMSKINWDDFNPEITAQCSEMFVLRGFKPLVKNMVESTPDGQESSLVLFSNDKSLQKFPGKHIVILNRAKENMHNMFMEVADEENYKGDE